MQTSPENIYQTESGTLTLDPAAGAPYLVRGAVIADEEYAKIQPLVSRETSDEAPETARVDLY